MAPLKRKESCESTHKLINMNHNIPYMVDHNGIGNDECLAVHIGVEAKNWMQAWKIVLNNMTRTYAAKHKLSKRT